MSRGSPVVPATSSAMLTPSGYPLHTREDGYFESPNAFRMLRVTPPRPGTHVCAPGRREGCRPPRGRSDVVAEPRRSDVVAEPRRSVEGARE